MHISEGVLSAPVLLGGAILAIGGVGIGLKKLRPEKVTLCGILSAAFFVGSLIHVPLGITNAHLLLNGLLGVALGWAAFPAIFVALLLQALLFQFGGLTTLGINTFCMGFSAILAWYSFRGIYLLFPSRKGLNAAAFCGGFLGVGIGSLLTSAALALTKKEFMGAAIALLAAHLPIMFVEGLITMFVVAFIEKIKPQMLLYGGNLQPD